MSHVSHDEHDVIVVGGGFAGLTAARELRAAGRRMLLLEGRDRLGGRTHTSDFAGAEVELGGAYVHWFQPHVFAELTRYGIAFTPPSEPARWSYVSQGRLHDRPVPDLMRRMTELFERVFPDTLALRTADLVEALLADARPDLRLSTPVSAIEQRHELVTVTARGGEAFSAPAVVVAVPLNTLAAIEFSPPLSPEKQAEAARGQASRGVKLWAQVPSELEPCYVMASDDEPITFFETRRLLADGSQLLVAFGPDAERLPPGDEPAVRRAFARLLPDGLEIVAVTGHDWLRDEFSRGTWSVFLPGQLSALPALQAPHGRVMFAGSDLADGWNGFIDGAIESGLRAGHSVARLLGAAPPVAVAS